MILTNDEIDLVPTLGLCVNDGFVRSRNGLFNVKSMKINLPRLAVLFSLRNSRKNPIGIIYLVIFYMTIRLYMWVDGRGTHQRKYNRLPSC